MEDLAVATVPPIVPHTTSGLPNEAARTVIEDVGKQVATSDIDVVLPSKFDRQCEMDKEKEAPETFMQFPLHYKEHAITKDSSKGLRGLTQLHSNPFPTLSSTSMSQFDSSRAQRGRFVQRIHRENDALEASALLAKTYFPHLFAKTTTATSTTQQHESSSTTNLDPIPSKTDDRMASMIHVAIEHHSSIGQSNSERTRVSNVSPFPSFTSTLLSSSSAWRNNSLNYDLLRNQMKKIVYIQQQLMSFIEETENRDRLINGESKDAASAAEEEKRLAVRDSPVRQRPDRTPKPPVESTYQPSPPRANISNTVLNALSAHPSFQLLQRAHAKFWSALTQEMDKLQQFISQPIHKQCTMDIFAEFESRTNGNSESDRNQQDKSEIPMETNGGSATTTAPPSFSRTCLCGCGTSYKHVFELLLEEMVQHGYSGSLSEKLNLAGIGEIALCQHAKLQIQRFMCALFHLDQMRKYLIHNYVIYQRVLDQYPHYTANTLLDQYHQRLFSMNKVNHGSEQDAEGGSDSVEPSSTTRPSSSIPFVSIQAFHLQQFLQRTSPFTPIRTFLEYMLQAERVSVECIERGTRFESNQSLYMHEPSHCALCHSGTISCSIQLPCCHIACFGCLVVQASFGIRCPLKYCLREIPSNIELVAKISMEEWLNQAKKRKELAPPSAGPQLVAQEMNKAVIQQQQQQQQNQNQALQQQQQLESQRKMYESRLHHQQQVLGPNHKGAIANLLIQEDQKISPGTISNFSEGDESSFTQASVVPVDQLHTAPLPVHSQVVAAYLPAYAPNATAAKIPSSHQEPLHVLHMNEVTACSSDEPCEAVDANGAPVSLLKHQPSRRGGSGYSCHSCKTTKEPSSLYFCSQIITRGKHARMCKKKYCACCLKRLYPAEFVPSLGTSFVCPSCKGACVCSSCTTAYRKQSADSASATSNTMPGDNLSMEDPANIAPIVYADVETPITNVTGRSIDSGLVVLNSSTSPLAADDVDMNLNLGLQGAKVDLSLSEPIDPATNPPRPLYSTARGQNKARTNKLRANNRLLKQPRAIRLPNKQGMRANHVTARSMGEGIEFATAVPIQLRASNAPIAAVTFDENGVVNANSVPFIVRSTPPSARHLLRRTNEEMSPLSGYQSFSEQSSPRYDAMGQVMYGSHLRKPSMVRRASAGEVLSQPSSRVSSRLQSPQPVLQQHSSMIANNQNAPFNARNLNQESCEWQQDPLLMMEQQHQRSNGYHDEVHQQQHIRYHQNHIQNQPNSPPFSSHSVSSMSMPANARMFTFSNSSSPSYFNSKPASASSSPHMPAMHHPPELGISRTLSPAHSSDAVANLPRFNPRHVSRASWSDSRSHRFAVTSSASVATTTSAASHGNLDLSNMSLTELQRMNEKLTKAMRQLQAEEVQQPDRSQPLMATVASFDPIESTFSKHYPMPIQKSYQPVNSHVNQQQQFPRQPQQLRNHHIANQPYPSIAQPVNVAVPVNQPDSDLSLPALPLSAQPPLRKQESWNDTVEQLSHSLVNQSEAQLCSPPPIDSSIEGSSQPQQQSGTLPLLSRTTSEAMVDAANNGLSYSLQAPPRHFSPPQAVQTAMQPLVDTRHSLHVPTNAFDSLNPSAHPQSKVHESTLLSPLDVPLMSPQEFDQMVSPPYHSRPNANQTHSQAAAHSHSIAPSIQPAAMQSQPLSLPTPSDTNMIRLESTPAVGGAASSNQMTGGMCLSLLTPLDTSMATHTDPHASPLWPAVANMPSSNFFMDRQRSFQDSISQPFMADANAI